MTQEKYQADGIMCVVQVCIETSKVRIVIGHYPQCDIVCDPSIAHGRTEVSSKLELQELSMLLCEGNNKVLM